MLSGLRSLVGLVNVEGLHGYTHVSWRTKITTPLGGGFRCFDTQPLLGMISLTDIILKSEHHGSEEQGGGGDGWLMEALVRDRLSGFVV